MWKGIKCAVWRIKKASSGTVCQGIKFLCTKCDKIFVTIKIDIKQMIEKQLKMEKHQEGLIKGLEDMKRER